MKAVVTGKTMMECIEKANMLQRFGWAIKEPIHYEEGQWKIVLYLRV